MTCDILKNLHFISDRQNIPRSCMVEVTKVCNFQCEHCYIPTDSVKDNRLPLEIYKRFFKELKQIGGVAVCFTGGEPLLFKEDLLEMLDMVRSEGMIPILFTNGSLITPEFARKIKEKRVAMVAISLYGSCSETMDRFTKHRGAFKKTIQGIKWLRDENIHVNVRWPVTQENVTEFMSFYDLARELGTEPSHFFGFRRCLDGSENPFKLHMNLEAFKQYIDTISVLDEFKEVLEKIQRDLSITNEKTTKQNYICSTGRGTMYLGSDGTLYPCSHITKPLGNIATTSLHEIWRDENPVLKEVRSATLDKMKCSNCEHLVDCGICKAEFYLKNGSFIEPDEHTCQLAQMSRRLRNYTKAKYVNNKK